MRQFAVIGLGSFGLQVARRLAANGGEVLAVDVEKNLVDEAKDFVVRSAGEEVPLSEAWAGTVRGPEWVLFGSGKSKRALYLIRHEADALPDTCQTMDGSMVLFGFGRKAMEAYLDFAPRHFTIGFADEASIPAATKEVESAWRPLRVTVGQGEAKYRPPAKP
jgi:hypothetical protein